MENDDTNVVFENGTRGLTMVNDAEKTTLVDSKVTMANSIQSFDQMYEALTAKFSGIVAIGSTVNMLTDRIQTLEEQRRQDHLSVANLIDEIKSMKKGDVTVASSSSLLDTAITTIPTITATSETMLLQASSPVDTTEKTLKAKMLLSLCNMDKVAPFDGEQGTDATMWLHDFVDKSNLAGATDEFRLKAAPMNFQGIAKTWYANHKEQINNWQVFVDQFLGYFCPDDNRRERLGEKLYTRRQYFNETALHYYDDVMRLCSKFNANMSAKDRVDILLKGTRPEAHDWIELRDPSTPAEFLKLISEFERRVNRKTETLDQTDPNDGYEQNREGQAAHQQKYQRLPQPPPRQQQLPHVVHQANQNGSQLDHTSDKSNNQYGHPARNGYHRRWQGNDQ